MLELSALELNGVFQLQCGKVSGSIFPNTGVRTGPQEAMIPTPASPSPHLAINDGVGNIAVKVDLEDRHNAKNSSYGVGDAKGKDSAQRNLVYTW